jgi:site-specific DNA-cytosine methylase
VKKPRGTKKAPAPTSPKAKAGSWGAFGLKQASATTPKTKKRPAPTPKVKRAAGKADDGRSQQLKASYTAGDDFPILSHPQDMFDDILKKTPELADVIKQLGRPLRIATMCSGTESPVLALDMMSRSAEDLGYGKLQIEHLFSCEIEPFKQAYIERNFQPPKLFRDIRELGNEKAVTAYGAAVEVPGGADMLIAGTSCVDYSNLNNEKKTIEGSGESGQTFRGMMDWIKKNEPPIVILENVSGAPWEQKVSAPTSDADERTEERANHLLSRAQTPSVSCARVRSLHSLNFVLASLARSLAQVRIFEEELGYHATFTRVDTKDYYIPQTRQRGYLFGVKKGRGVDKSAVRQWIDCVKDIKRPASAALDAFMFPSDDPRVLKGRERLSAGRGGAAEKTGRVDWARCEARHLFARSSENLGDKRPLTGWSDSGNVTLPSYAWNEWANAQVHRIHDLMDINMLRLAKGGVDGTYVAAPEPAPPPPLPPLLTPPLQPRAGSRP